MHVSVSTTFSSSNIMYTFLDVISLKSAKIQHKNWNMCAYISMYMCVCVCVCMFACVYVCVPLYACVCMCVYVVGACVYMCCVFMCLSVYVCM